MGSPIDYEPRYYDMDGNPITVEQWGEDFGNPKKILRRTAFDCPSGSAEISTVWLGLDHSFDGKGPPVIFESLIFCGCEHELMFRAHTREEALRAHEALIESHRRGYRYVLKDNYWLETREEIVP